MSKVSELAEAEASAVEAEEAEAAEAGETTPEPTPEPEPEPAAQAEGVFDPEQAERELQKWLNGIKRVLGDQVAQLEPCPTCSTWPFVGFKPFEALPEMRDLEDTEVCASCNGYGVTLTKSLIPEQRTKLCTSCNATGYRTVAMPEPISLVTAPTQPMASAEPYPGYGVPFVPVPGGVPDGYNRPAGHPHWGQSPEYSKAVANR